MFGNAGRDHVGGKKQGRGARVRQRRSLDPLTEEIHLRPRVAVEVAVQNVIPELESRGERKPVPYLYESVRDLQGVVVPRLRKVVNRSEEHTSELQSPC